ncbi:MAG: alpha/beta hydrolase [Agarilytica sp.]
MRIVFGAIVFLICVCCNANDAAPTAFHYSLPAHLSEGARDYLIGRGPRRDLGDDHLKIRQLYAGFLKARVANAKKSGLEFSSEAVEIAGVKVFWVKAKGVKTRKKILIHTHGGGYYAGSAENMVDFPAKISKLTGLPVVSIEYGLAPEAPWPIGLNQSVAVYQALLEQGYKAKNIAWFGESAGGGLAMAAMQSMKRQKIKPPAAVYVQSPWVDLVVEGDSFDTLEGSDPILSSKNSIPTAIKYAGDNDRRQPEISPIYGDFHKHPPVLIQTGTKETLLSDSVRLARAMRAQKAEVILDIWDGMWHVFHDKDATVSEAKEALEYGAQFLKNELRL